MIHVIISSPCASDFFNRIIIIKCNAKHCGKSLSWLFSDMVVINEEAISCIVEESKGAINESVIGAIILPRKPPSCFFLFHFLLFQSHH